MPYDPQLPILAELEHHIRGLALAAEGEAADAATVHHVPGAGRSRPARGEDRRRRRDAGRGSVGRLLRRGAVLALLGCTVGATATALNRAGDRRATGSPGVVASGRAGGASWRLEVTRREGRLCPAIVVSGPRAPGAALATDCVAAPTGGTVLPTTAMTADRVVVVGLAGPQVRAVRVTVAHRRRTVRTQALPAGDADGPRTFAAVLRRPAGEQDVVPRLRPLGAGRAAIGRVVRDCSAAPRAASCARRPTSSGGGPRHPRTPGGEGGAGSSPRTGVMIP